MESTLTSQVFIDYDLDSPPPHPGDVWTRFVCISDTHSRTFKVPPGDVLLHAGDLTSYGRIPDLRKTMAWIMTLPHPIKILIGGNHDLCLDKTLMQDLSDDKVFEAAQEIVRGPAARRAGVRYLEHETTEFVCRGRKWKVYGSPAAPEYSAGAFQYGSRATAEDIYGRIPFDTDVLLTHTPPHGAHDLTKRGKQAGCPYLTERIQILDEGAVSVKEESKSTGSEKKWSCRLHVWGHIHEAHGASILNLPQGERVQANAAVAWKGRPIIVDIRDSDDYLTLAALDIHDII